MDGLIHAATIGAEIAAGIVAFLAVLFVGLTLLGKLIGFVRSL